VDVIKNSKDYSSTLPLIIILLFFPVIGTLLYIIIYQNKNNSRILKNIVKSEKNSKKYLIPDKQMNEKIQNNNRLRYISDFAGFPITQNNNVCYYALV
ncbi:MAG: PLD nuclease N-terminal domain-containing protein, partial [Bacilli bacterium]|nr:PLD nuclease N-terminal domain-containing protein [Bacilli bacterium]